MNSPTTTPAIPDDIAQPKQLAPVSVSQRIDVLDILRGFALVGILLMNIEWFNRPIASLMQFDFDARGVNYGISWLIKCFVEGKFYKLFALLFGMGFAVMLLRAQEVGRPFGFWFTRRMVALFAIGIAHMVFLWGGDILHDYAFSGMLLLGWIYLVRLKWLKRFSSPKSFLRLGLSMLLLPIIVSMIAGVYFGASRDRAEINQSWQDNRQVMVKYNELKASNIDLLAEQDKEPVLEDAQQTLENNDSSTDIENEANESAVEELVEEALTAEEKILNKAENKLKREQRSAIRANAEVEAFTQTSWFIATDYRWNDIGNFLKNTPGFAIFQLFPLFLVGFWFIASGVLKDIDNNKRLFKSMAGVGLIGGLLMSIGGVTLALHPVADEVIEVAVIGNAFFTFGHYALTTGYIGAIVLAANTVRGARWLSIFAPLGRMALTNYITHSIILTSIFYGYAGGMFGQIDRITQVLIVLAILIVQLIVCHIWLKLFRFGPLEWLWRCITYLKLQPIKI